jgi:hypothetical protein
VDNPIWLAPEIIAGLPYSVKVDTYSYGMTLWEILARAEPFGAQEFVHELEPLILDGERPPIPSHTPAGYATLINTCWVWRREEAGTVGFSFHFRFCISAWMLCKISFSSFPYDPFIPSSDIQNANPESRPTWKQIIQLLKELQKQSHELDRQHPQPVCEWVSVVITRSFS